MGLAGYYSGRNSYHNKYYRETCRGKWNMYRCSAKKRGIEWKLSYEDFQAMWQKDCYYCGSPVITIGVDRKDPTIGYIKENCVSSCWTCNSSKGSLSENHFIELCERIVSHQFRKNKKKGGDYRGA